MEDFSAWRERAAAATEPVPTAPDAIAFWLYSSGSTGRPKGTVHTHANLLRTAETYGRGVLDLREGDVTFSAAKLFFAYGLGNALTFPLSVGATVVLMAERPTPAAVFKRLVTHKPTVFFGVPTLYAAMLASPELPSRADVALRRCVSAGEPLPKEIGERFAARFGCDVLDGIGSTEMLHIFLSNRPGDVRYGTTGTPVPGYDIELRGEDGRLACRRRDRRSLHPRPERGAHVLGQRREDRARRSRASGRAAATSTCATPTAGIPTPGAATTC